MIFLLKIDVFVVDSFDLGTLYALKIRQDCNGKYIDWFIESIEINDEYFNYIFKCNSWLSPNKDDQLTERMIIESNAAMQFQFDNVVV